MSEQITSHPVTPGQTAESTIVSPTCLLCHTVDHTVTSDSLRAGADWTCTRCGQRWSAARLATAAAYARYPASLTSRIPAVAA